VPSRVLATLVRNADGTFTLIRRARETFVFDVAGRLSREVDVNGYATALAYGAGGQLATVTEPAGRQLTFSYGADGHVSVVSDPSRTVSYGYDTAGNLTSVTDSRGGVSSFGYDTRHLLTSMTDQRSKTTTNTYDAAGRVLTQTDPMGRVLRFAYSTYAAPGSLTTTVTDPRGNVSVHRYAGGLLASETKGYGTPKEATWTYAYDPVTDGLASVTDPNGHVSSASYDGAGNRLTATDALNHTTTSSYDALNDPTSVTDPLGVTTTLSYDAAGNLLTTATPLTGTSQVRRTTLTYGDTAHPGDVTAVTDPNGKVWSYAYNTKGDLRRSVDPVGNITTATYNTIGQRISAVSPRGNATGGTPANFTTTYGWNNFGELTSATDPLGHVTSFVYDAAGNRTQATDAEGRITRTSYDGDNEPTTITRPDLSTLGYGYDANGNQLRQTDGAGRDTSYGYDPLNRLSSVTDPLGRKTTLGYDAAGNLTRRTDPAGGVTTMSYDAADRSTAIDYADPASPDVSLGYDAAGRRTTMTDGSSAYGYDSLGRLTAATDGAGATVGYGYDLAGALTALTYPGATGTVARGFDDAGRLTSVTDWATRTSLFGYDRDGNLTTIGYPNVTAAALTYDNADRLSSVAHARGGTTLASFGYTRTSAGQLAGLTTTGTPQGNETYGYTALNQLATVSAGSYGYDAADNLTTLPGAAALTYDLANELTGLTPATGPATSYGYDSRGNRTSAAVTGGTTTTYGYDAASRLVSLAGTGVPTPASYAYNGDGLRVAKTVGTASSRFSWDLAQGLPLALSDGTNSYLYGPGGMPLEQVSTTGTVTYLHADQLGSTRLVTDSAGTVVGTRAYDAYGKPSGQTGAVATPFGYAGEYTDAESGLVYLRARYYDPATGQFLTRDPLAALTQSPYGYVHGDPLNGTDPSGLCGFFGSGPCPGANWLDSALHTGAGKAATSALVGIGDGATFGATATIRAAISPGSSCTFAHDGWHFGGMGFGGVGALIATGGTSAAEGGVDVGTTTAHGAVRIAGAGATRGGVLSSEQILNVRSAGEVWSQTDGAAVRILQNSAGRYDVVVDGDRGLITTFSNLSQKSIDRLASNYGWTP